MLGLRSPERLERTRARAAAVGFLPAHSAIAIEPKTLVVATISRPRNRPTLTGHP